MRCAFLCAALTLGTYAGGYVFFVLDRETFRIVIGTSEDALHWPESRFPDTILIPDGGANLDIPGLSPTVGVFVSDLRFAREDGWFEQTAMLEWLAELEIRATASGCAPVDVSCDSFGCVNSALPR